MWMCQVGNKPDGGEGCGYFEWARFTDDGVPVGWKDPENEEETPANKASKSDGTGLDGVKTSRDELDLPAEAGTDPKRNEQHTS